jgi:hypothetical protein
MASTKKKKKKNTRKENAEKTVERDPFRKRWKGICKAGQNGGIPGLSSLELRAAERKERREKLKRKKEGRENIIV